MVEEGGFELFILKRTKVYRTTIAIIHKNEYPCDSKNGFFMMSQKRIKVPEIVPNNIIKHNVIERIDFKAFFINILLNSKTPQ